MKKWIALLLVLTLLSLAACGGKPAEIVDNTDETAAAGDTPTQQSGEVLTDAQGNVATVAGAPEDGAVDYKEKFEPLEYAEYCKIFYEYLDFQNEKVPAYEQTTKYDGKEMTKDGTFGIIEDAFNNMTRYYVWGYSDKTRCCCYQWEFVPNDASALPEPGSYIQVKGTFAASADALDSRWIENADVTVQQAYTPDAGIMDLTLLSPTLVYVQVANMLNRPESFTGRTMRIFGRAYGPATLQHPYYDGSWQLDFTSDQQPAAGTYLTLTGTYADKLLTVTDYISY